MHKAATDRAGRLPWPAIAEPGSESRAHAGLQGVRLAPANALRPAHCRDGGREKLRHPGAPALMQVATVIGIIWAGSLVASGMISNAGLVPTATLYANDPTQAALTWQGVEIVADGIGNGNGEILGGVWILLVSLAALRSGYERHGAHRQMASAW